MTGAGSAYGPWATGLDHAERLARLRSMRAIVRLSTGPRGDHLAELLHRAERDPRALEPALVELDSLDPLDRRRILASFAALARPAAA